MLKKIIMFFISVGLIGFISFYLLIGLGLSPKLQTLWVTTAMTTMNTKWAATLFISDTRIEKIMSENKVNDEGLSSDLSLIDVSANNSQGVINYEIPKYNRYVDIVKDTILSDVQTSLYEHYERNGYTKLEDGLYIKEVVGDGFKGKLILIEDSKRVKLVQTKYQFERGQHVKKMVLENNAIFGVNGGGFSDGPNYDSNGGIPAGMLIVDGELIYPNYETNAEMQMIGLNSDGILVLKRCTTDWALSNNIVSAVSFGPYLIVNGEPTIKKGQGGWGIAPRTAIGQRKTGEIIFLLIDGRQPLWSIGTDLKVVQDILLEEGCVNAANLDGGSSTVGVYNGEFINKPSQGFERSINNCFIYK